ncbi:MAG: ABC transporter substrate-binding protein [Gammaproteobacteria bacterium]|jgi:ABC-type nitrate/sulfonate/bicarbonate transport system substrate-binding protein
MAQPQGTGAMARALRNGELDAAVLLTEGAVAAYAGGAEFDIVATYVESPLEWGIHVRAASDFADEASIQGARYAISRFGSGSHLMSCAHARARGWPLAGLRFVPVGTIDGARTAFQQDRADVFFWEQAMTQPLVDAGEFRRVGTFAAPWPAFVLCIGKRVSSAARRQIEALFDDVLTTATHFAADTDGSARRIADEFGIERAAAARWLARTRWAAQRGIDEDMLRSVAQVLMDAEVIDHVPAF